MIAKRTALDWVVILSLSVLCFGSPVAADTGTYAITEYEVTLSPLEDGRVQIAYYQKWRVTGGNIPWITVGMANSSYTILKEQTGGSAASIGRADSGSWMGVRIVLDRDYQSGEEFEVRFAVIQERLFYQSEQGYRLDFTPGWYDRANTGSLTVRFEFFTALEGVLTVPKAARVDDRMLLWEPGALAAGSRFDVAVVIPPELFPGEIALAQPPSEKDEIEPVLLIALLPIVILLPILIVVIVRRSGRGGKGGGYGGGGHVGLGHLAATAHGGAVSCACACVACACACACAGGGAAGCDRKLTRTCSLCAECEKQDCPLRQVA